MFYGRPRTWISYRNHARLRNPRPAALQAMHLGTFRPLGPRGASELPQVLVFSLIQLRIVRLQAPTAPSQVGWPSAHASAPPCRPSPCPSPASSSSARGRRCGSGCSPVRCDSPRTCGTKGTAGRSRDAQWSLGGMKGLRDPKGHQAYGWHVRWQKCASSGTEHPTRAIFR